MKSLDNEINKYLQEAARDAKILRNINIDHIKKEEPKVQMRKLGTILLEYNKWKGTLSI